MGVNTGLQAPRDCNLPKSGKDQVSGSEPQRGGVQEEERITGLSQERDGRGRERIFYPKGHGHVTIVNSRLNNPFKSIKIFFMFLRYYEDR